MLPDPYQTKVDDIWRFWTIIDYFKALFLSCHVSFKSYLPRLFTFASRRVCEVLIFFKSKNYSYGEEGG